MAMKLSTTLQHINTIPDKVNAQAVKEFYNYLKEIGTSKLSKSKSKATN
jgi:hypothetical protein